MYFQEPYTLGPLIIAIIVLFTPTIIKCIHTYFHRKKNRQLRKMITSGTFIHYKTFEKNWIIKRPEKGISGVGYKYNDTPGCYVIAIYEKPTEPKNYLNYKNIYIGQSVNVFHRIHQHFTGHGNGDVYADIKYGKHVYVQIIPCKKSEMNKMEKNLISAFRATKSYNVRKGGAEKRSRLKDKNKK